MKPKSTENVIAYKIDTGRVRVHRRSDDWDWSALGYLTGCKRLPEWKTSRAWLWVEYRTLNPEMVRLCKRCWS